MGRVDEAMRRAAGQPPTPPERAPEAVPSSVPAVEEVTDLPRGEVVPEAPLNRGVTPAADSADHRRLRRESPAAAAVAAPGPKPPKLLPIRERLDDALQRKVVVDPNMAPSSREQYRRLAAGLHQNQLSQGAKVVMVTSALAGEGKTLTASNLALTLSESYRRQVLLIDADLRKPSLHVVFSLKVTEGLCEGLAAPADEQLALHQVSPFLTILPAGRPTSDPMGVLTSDRMRRLVDEARETFDWVVIDTPPVGLLPDANLLASMVDGALVVIRADATPHALVQRAVEAIGTDKILGVILNRATTHTVASSYHYHTYYKPTPEGVAPPG